MVIREAATNECPVSLISPFSKVIVSTFHRAVILKGVVPILNSGAELPAKMVDALEVTALEKSRTDYELHAGHTNVAVDVEDE